MPAPASKTFSLDNIFSEEGKQLLTVEGSMDFWIGFLNSTHMYNISNLQVCSDAIVSTWVAECNEAMSEVMNGQFFDALRSFLSVLSSSDYVAHECYQGFYEMSTNYQSTIDALTPKVGTIGNVAYHFSAIYDNLQNVYLYLFNTPYVSPSKEAPQSLSEAGQELGDVVFLTYE